MNTFFEKLVLVLCIIIFLISLVILALWGMSSHPLILSENYYFLHLIVFTGMVYILNKIMNQSMLKIISGLLILFFCFDTFMAVYDFEFDKYSANRAVIFSIYLLVTFIFFVKSFKSK